MIEQSPKNISARPKRWSKRELWLLAVPLLVPLLVFGWIAVNKIVGSIESKQALRTLTLPYPATAIAFSPDGEIVATGDGHVSTEVRIWHLKRGRLLHTIKTGHNAAVWSLAFSPDSQTIVTSGRDDGRLRLWDVQTGQLLRTFAGRQSLIPSLVFSSDGKTLVSGGGTANVWDVSTGQLLYTLGTGKDYIFAVRIISDGKTLLAATAGGTSSWDLKTGKGPRTLSGRYDTEIVDAFTGVFSLDGKLLAVGKRRDPKEIEKIELWDVQSGKPLRTLSGYGGGAYSTDLRAIAFSPDSKILVNGSFREPMKLWDVQTGKLLRTLKEDLTCFYSAAFSPDGKTLAGGHNNKVYLWNLSISE